MTPNDFGGPLDFPVTPPTSFLSLLRNFNTWIAIRFGTDVAQMMYPNKYCDPLTFPVSLIL